MRSDPDCHTDLLGSVVREMIMNRFDGTAARQLLLVDERDTPIRWREAPRRI